MITMMLFQTTRNTVTIREYPELTLASCCFGWSFRWFSGWVVSWWKIPQENFEPKRVTRRCALWSWKHPKGKKHLCLMASKKMFFFWWVSAGWLVESDGKKAGSRKGGPSGNKWKKQLLTGHTQALNSKKMQKVSSLKPFCGCEVAGFSYRPSKLATTSTAAASKGLGQFRFGCTVTLAVWGPKESEIQDFGEIPWDPAESWMENHCFWGFLILKWDHFELSMDISSVETWQIAWICPRRNMADVFWSCLGG